MTLATFIHYVLEMDPLLFLSFVFWASVGVLLCLLLNANQRSTVNNMQTRFNWKCLLFYNRKRILISFIMILVTIRFSKQLIGLDQNSFSAFIIGFGSDHLGKFIQNKLSNIRDKQLNLNQEQ